MAHYGRYLFHFQNVTFNVTFPKVAFCRQEYPTFYPALSATIAGHFGRSGGHPRGSCGVFRVPLDGQDIDRPGAAVPVYFPCGSLWLRFSGSGCPVLGQRFSSPVSGSGCPVQRFPDIAPDRATLNKVKRSFSGRFRYWLNCRENGKGGAVLFVRIVTACDRAERSTCGAASFGLQSVGFLFGQYPRFTDLEPSFAALTAFPQGRYTERPERGRLCQCKEWFFIIFWR
jgi:hypothetical protein